MKNSSVRLKVEPPESTTDIHNQRTPMVKGQKRKRPAWAQWNFDLPVSKPATAKVCMHCGKACIPRAVLNKLYFCTFQHGKFYIKEHRKNAAKESYAPKESDS